MKNTNTIATRISGLDEEIRYLEKLVSDAPAGKLIVRRNPSGSYRYYRKRKTEGNKCTEEYLSGNKLEIARALALRDYSKNRIQDAIRERHYLNLNLKALNNEKQADHYLNTHPGAAELILPLLRKRADYLEAWKNAPYARSQDHPEDLIYTTVVEGLLVRSKAEADILSRFEFFGVPYHYEDELRYGSTIIHPDFTCRNLSTGKIIYWEHQGKWDDPGYMPRINKRNDIFCRLGISPGDNLIVTAETRTHPLDIQWVDQLIQYYLL